MERLVLLTVVVLASLLEFSDGKHVFQVKDSDPYVLHLVAKTIPVAENCGKIVYSVYQKAIDYPNVGLGDTIGLVIKGNNNSRPDYQTDADTTSQVYAREQLKDCVAGFIGEEEDIEETRPRIILSELEFKSITVNGTLNVDSVDHSPGIPDNIKLWTAKDTSLHADPLDSTLDFVNGIKAMQEYLRGLKELEFLRKIYEMTKKLGEAKAMCAAAKKIEEKENANVKKLAEAKKLLFSVSVLLGYAYKNKLGAGVMFQPFSDWKDGKPVGRMVWGIVGYGYGGFTIGNLPETLTIAITGSNLGVAKILTEEIGKLLPNAIVVLMGGTIKGFLVATGMFHAWMDCSNNTKTWDSTAPAAVAVSSGGIFTDIEGNDVAVKCEVGKPTDHYRNNGVLLVAAGVTDTDQQILRNIAKAAKARNRAVVVQ